MHIEHLAAFLEDCREDAAEASWSAGLAMIERACARARESETRFRFYPPGELRKLRRGIARGLVLCRFAVALQQDENALMHELMEPAREAARAARLERLRRTNPKTRHLYEDENGAA
jgi:hypothetical protein